MFGQMMVEPVVQLDPGVDLETSIATLIKVAENVEIVRWIELPASVLLFLLVPGDPDSGAVYVLDRKKGTDIPRMLTDETIRQHLEGKITVGLYAINPSTQRCKWVAIDADYKNSMEDLIKLQYHLGQEQVHAALEASRRGGHLWTVSYTHLTLPTIYSV